MQRMSITLSLLALSSLVVGIAQAQTAGQVVPGEYIIKYKSASGGTGIVARQISGHAVMRTAFSGLNMYHVKMTNPDTEAADVAAIRQDPNVAYVEPNYSYTKASVAQSEGEVTTMTLSEWQSLLGNPSTAAYNQGTAPTQTAQSWAIESATSTASVVVAVVDTGLDSTHRLFLPYTGTTSGGSGALWNNTAEINGVTGVDDDGNGFVDDYHGWNFITNTNNFYDDESHGTHVSGIIVGAGLDISASNLSKSKISVMPLKFLDSTGSGSTANAISAIYYAVNNGAQIISNSWGGSSYSAALYEALDYAYNNHVLVVSAAGNYSSDNDTTPMYPASYTVPSNLAVASTSSYDSLSSFSNYGPTSVGMGSPGEYIVSSVPGNAYEYMSGTSMATPFVSGMAALALREAPSLTGYQLKTLILSQGDAVTSLASTTSSGLRLNSLKIIEGAKAMVSTAAYQPAYVAEAADRSVASDSSAAAGCGMVSTGGGASLVQTLKNFGGGRGGPWAGGALFVGLMLLPLLFWAQMRVRAPKNKRKYDRYKINSQISVNVGGRELIGSLNSISQGGVSFNAEEALEKGGMVTMRIQSPDGHEMIEVQGQVVWNEKNHSYGVQFAEARQGTMAMIKQWSQNLVKI